MGPQQVTTLGFLGGLAGQRWWVIVIKIKSWQGEKVSEVLESQIYYCVERVRQGVWQMCPQPEV
jgi:hypothetical protein